MERNSWQCWSYFFWILFTGKNKAAVRAPVHNVFGNFGQTNYGSAKMAMVGLMNTLKIDGKLSPKILIVKPKARLSWQYHNRRAEIWQVYKGLAGIIRSYSNEENEMKVYKEGDQIELQQGERHRLIGLDGYCVVAEIWQHTDKDNPSDEEDIIRVQDDFGR